MTKNWIGCPETSVINYYYSLRSFPEESSSHLLRGQSLKSRKKKNPLFQSGHLILRAPKFRAICKLRNIFKILFQYLPPLSSTSVDQEKNAEGKSPLGRSRSMYEDNTERCRGVWEDHYFIVCHFLSARLSHKHYH